MIPEPTENDLARDANNDWLLVLANRVQIPSFVPVEAWIRRAVAAEKRAETLSQLASCLADLLVSSNDGEVDCGACGAVLACPGQEKREHEAGCPVAAVSALLEK